uniref:Consortin, connexin sorting protein n=1 Tax=Jaculus jaculus TaxID=51337 RepID=A0A8C5L2M6_JACJA
MDDRDTPTCNLQIEPQDGRHPGDSVERRITHLPSAPDENENQLAGDVPESLSRSDGAMGKTEVLEQDSLNNNAACPPRCEAPGQDSEHTQCEGPKDGQSFPGKDRNLSGKRSTRTKKGTSRKMPPGDSIPLMQEKTWCATRSAGGEETSANDPPEAPKPALQPLFSLIRGEVEQMDSRALPLFLHQVWPLSFDLNEKAMKFIQLERLYHEQLLANLSAIQEQWETKWKAVQPQLVTPLRNSEKGFNGEDFEQLAKFCTTHQEKCCTQLTVSEVPEEKGVAAKGSETGTCPGMEPSTESQLKEQPQESSPCCHQMDWQAASPNPPVPAGKERSREPPCCTEATPQLHTPSPGAAGSRSGQGPDAAEHACGDDRRPAPPEDVAQDPKESLPSESVVEPLASPGHDHLPPGLICEHKYSQKHRKELHLPLLGTFEALPAARPESSKSNGLQQPDLPGGDGQSEAGGDYLNSLLEGRLTDTEDPLPDEENQDDDSDLPQDLSPEEASYSLQESLPADDSCLSLDDLAKRIEIAQVVPAEGLVSILKKRSDSPGDHPAQMQQKPSKRRVRFQEMDDSLDQDEVGGGSCILLILLCIATVFLSIGGTALYCTFGDMESPVCTDFADNMDFYYTKLLQGMAELKHWIYLS